MNAEEFYIKKINPDAIKFETDPLHGTIVKLMEEYAQHQLTEALNRYRALSKEDTKRSDIIQRTVDAINEVNPEKQEAEEVIISALYDETRDSILKKIEAAILNQNPASNEK